jgi:hypothetical protein
MQFTYYDLGYRSSGDAVDVLLSGSAANVRLLDSSNYQNYKSGRPHTYYGGLAKRSPVRLAIPHSGHWYLTVDLQGLRGSTRSSIRIIPRQALAPLPEITQRPLTNLVHPIEHDRDVNSGSGKSHVEYDVFVSHATEDKEEVVRPLANALVTEGLKVWYDEFELRIGDSLRRKIDAGLAKSRFGVVVVSHAFFAKNWPQYELDGLVTREMSGQQVILPLWHRITKAEVIAQSPSLADKVARSTSDFTVNEIAKEIASVIRDAR